MKRLFVIGGSGYVGAALIRRLTDDGLTVLALSRSAEADAKLARLGARPLRGDVEALEALRDGAEGSDAVIYAARWSEAEPAALEALVETLAGSGKPLIFTSGASLVAETTAGGASPRQFSEEDPADPPRGSSLRLQSEAIVRRAAGRGVRGMVIRPPLIYGHGGSVQIPHYAACARRTGTVAYVGEGLNRWAFIHVDELAEMYVRALAAGSAGALYHCVAGEVEMGELAHAVARTLGVPAESCSLAQAEEVYGKFVARVPLGSSCRPLAPVAECDLEWRPRRTDIFEDVARGSYFETWKAAGLVRPGA